jgi:hypothetical protein
MQLSKKLLNVFIKFPASQISQAIHFLKYFHFCILIDPTMRISHTGKSIKSLFPVDTVLTGRHVDEIFRIIRPDIVLEWNKVND